MTESPYINGRAVSNELRTLPGQIARNKQRNKVIKPAVLKCGKVIKPAVVKP